MEMTSFLFLNRRELFQKIRQKYQNINSLNHLLLKSKQINHMTFIQNTLPFCWFLLLNLDFLLERWHQKVFLSGNILNSQINKLVIPHATYPCPVPFCMITFVITSFISHLREKLLFKWTANANYLVYSTI